MSTLGRAVLKCYPRWWREQHGDEALGLLQDSADARGRVDLRDLLNLAVHAARLRITAAGAPAAVPGIRSRVALVAVALLGTISLTLLVFGEWAPWDPGTSFHISPVANLTTGSLCYLSGLLAAIAVAFGRTLAARRLAAFAGLSALAIMAPPIEQLAESQGFLRPPGVLLAFVAVICCLASIGEPVLPRGSRSLFAVLAAIPAVSALLATALNLGPDPWYYYRLADQVALRAQGGFVLGIGLTVAAVVLLAGRHRVWAAALALNAVPWLLLFYFAPLTPGFGALVTVIAVALMAAGSIAATVQRRAQLENSVVSSE